MNEENTFAHSLILVTHQNHTVYAALDYLPYLTAMRTGLDKKN